MTAPTPAITFTMGGVVTFKALASNVATLTTSLGNDMNVGDVVAISGVDATFNSASAVVLSTPTPTTFTYAATAANVATTAATGIVTPTTLSLDRNNPQRILFATDTAASTPAPTLRTWKNGAVTVPVAGGVNATAPTLRINQPGSVSLTCTENNGDAGGPVQSAAVVVTLNDTVVTAFPPILLLDGTTRCSPTYLPSEYRDPTVATPGLPTAQNLSAAKLYGSVLPAAQQLAAVTG